MGATIAERLNNAIVSLEWLASRDKRVSAGVKRSIVQLGEHWDAYFAAVRRSFMPVPLLQPKLERYAHWYARAWMLLPADMRNELTHPRDIDASMSAAIDDTLRTAVEAYSSAGAAAKGLVDDVASVATEAVSEAADRVRSDVVGLGVLLIAGLLAYGWARRA